MLSFNSAREHVFTGQGCQQRSLNRQRTQPNFLRLSAGVMQKHMLATHTRFSVHCGTCTCLWGFCISPSPWVLALFVTSGLHIQVRVSGPQQPRITGLLHTHRISGGESCHLHNNTQHCSSCVPLTVISRRSAKQRSSFFCCSVRESDITRKPFPLSWT